VECDAVVVGSGAGGAMAAANLARAGMRTVVLEAGPRVRAEDMVRDVPLFMARHFWDGGLRMIGGTTTAPSLQGRCLGGSTVVNRALLPAALADGAAVCTCSVAERILIEGGRAVGVTGAVVDPHGLRERARFTVRAKRVVLAAGTMQTPVLLQDSGITGGGTV